MKSFLEEAKWGGYIEEILRDLKFYSPEDPWFFLYERAGMRLSK